jgi:hypothetical protein
MPAVFPLKGHADLASPRRQAEAADDAQAIMPLRDVLHGTHAARRPRGHHRSRLPPVAVYSQKVLEIFSGIFAGSGQSILGNDRVIEFTSQVCF